jgi:hypothetical protein
MANVPAQPAVRPLSAALYLPLALTFSLLLHVLDFVGTAGVAPGIYLVQRAR